MILNIKDSRKRRNRWKAVDAVIEPTWYDNTLEDADQSSSSPNESECESREGISLSEAVAWAGSVGYPVTLFLYDAGDLNQE